MPNPKGHEESIKDSRFKAAWQSGPTRTIRVPITLADATLEYARQLDQGIEPHDTREAWNDETQAVLTLADFFEPRDTRTKSHSSTPKNDIATAKSRDTMLEEEVKTTELHLQYLRESLEGLQEEMLKKSGLNDSPELSKLKAGVTNIELLIELSKLQTELEAYKEQQPASEFELPEAPELLNRLKAKRKKATASLADIEAILEILEES
jgi:chromosome segregation ATPase